MTRVNGRLKYEGCRKIKRRYGRQGNRTISCPDLLELDSEDPTKRHAFKVIPENGDRVLRVIYNENNTPWSVISAYFDRKRRGTL